MFFVSLLLNAVVGWMRAQTGHLEPARACVYMDEIFGYFPPVANPPSKAPLLTLLKQGRAFGVGVRARDAEPGRSRLQGAVEHRHLVHRPAADRARQGARARRPRGRAATAAGFDRAEVERLLSALASRVFLMRNVHEDAPTLFQSRWALSYLRGPLSRDEIKRLTAAAAERADAGRRRHAAARSAPRRAPCSRGRRT